MPLICATVLMQMFDCFSLQPCNMDSNEAMTRALTDDRELVLPEPDISEDTDTVWPRLDCQDRTLV